MTFLTVFSVVWLTVGVVGFFAFVLPERRARLQSEREMDGTK